MSKYLLVAHQTSERRELLEAARDLAAHDDQAEFTLIVPATPVGDLLVWDEGDTKEIAQRRARSAADRLQMNGIKVVDARVGDADPVLAIDDEFTAGRRYGAIVISTLPPGLSRWIKMDAVSRIRRTHPLIRLIHVVSSEEPTSGTPNAEPL